MKLSRVKAVTFVTYKH